METAWEMVVLERAKMEVKALETVVTKMEVKALETVVMERAMAKMEVKALETVVTEISSVSIANTILMKRHTRRLGSMWSDLRRFFRHTGRTTFDIWTNLLVVYFGKHIGNSIGCPRIYCLRSITSREFATADLWCETRSRMN
jgi:hypothetical protein